MTKLNLLAFACAVAFALASLLAGTTVLDDRGDCEVSTIPSDLAPGARYYVWVCE